LLANNLDTLSLRASKVQNARHHTTGSVLENIPTHNIKHTSLPQAFTCTVPQPDQQKDQIGIKLKISVQEAPYSSPRRVKWQPRLEIFSRFISTKSLEHY
jgi:hypothetical protein